MLKLAINAYGSAVAQWLAHGPLVLEVPSSIPAGGEEKSVFDHAYLRVICKDDMNTVLRPSDRKVNWRHPVKGQSFPV